MCVFCPEYLEREVNKCNLNHAVPKDDKNCFENKYFKIRSVKILTIRLETLVLVSLWCYCFYVTMKIQEKKKLVMRVYVGKEEI